MSNVKPYELISTYNCYRNVNAFDFKDNNDVAVAHNDCIYLANDEHNKLIKHVEVETYGTISYFLQFSISGKYILYSSNYKLMIVNVETSKIIFINPQPIGYYRFISEDKIINIFYNTVIIYNIIIDKVYIDKVNLVIENEYNLQKEELDLSHIEQFNYAFKSCNVSPDKCCISSDYKYIAFFLDDKNGYFCIMEPIVKSIIVLRHKNNNICQGLQFSKDCKFLVSWGNYEFIIWNLSNYSIVKKIETLYLVRSLCISPMNNYILVGTTEGEIIFYSIKTGSIIRTLKVSMRDSILGIKYSPVGGKLYVMLYSRIKIYYTLYGEREIFIKGKELRPLEPVINKELRPLKPVINKELRPKFEKPEKELRLLELTPLNKFFSHWSFDRHLVKEIFEFM